jgi:hypothetical protein
MYSVKKYVFSAVFIVTCITAVTPTVSGMLLCCCTEENRDDHTQFIMQETTYDSPPNITRMNIEPTPEVDDNPPPYSDVAQNIVIAEEQPQQQTPITPRLQICTENPIVEAKKFFNEIETRYDINQRKKMAVIFDIDYTTLATSSKPYTVITLSQTQCQKYPAIPEMLELYKKTIDLGFQIFFVTSRSMQTILAPDDEYDYLDLTIDNLKEVGYTGYTTIIAMPRDIHQHCFIVKNSNLFAAQWKYSIRQQIHDNYNIEIIATFDDDPIVLDTKLWPYCTGQRFLISRPKAETNSYQNNQFSSPGGPALTSAMQHDGLSWYLDTQYS